jgi:hypothetical protein
MMCKRRPRLAAVPRRDIAFGIKRPALPAAYRLYLPKAAGEGPCASAQTGAQRVLQDQACNRALATTLGMCVLPTARRGADGRRLRRRNRSAYQHQEPMWPASGPNDGRAPGTRPKPPKNWSVAGDLQGCCGATASTNRPSLVELALGLSIFSFSLALSGVAPFTS